MPFSPYELESLLKRIGGSIGNQDAAPSRATLLSFLAENADTIAFTDSIQKLLNTVTETDTAQQRLYNHQWNNEDLRLASSWVETLRLPLKWCADRADEGFSPKEVAAMLQAVALRRKARTWEDIKPDVP